MAACKQKGGGSKTSVNLSTEWLELESDPGLFTLLIQDFGVRGVKVEEVYDVSQTFKDGVYGFVFLFQWTEDRRARKKFLQSEECFVTETSVLQSMFFAHQIVANSCATHALLSILLNCSEEQNTTVDLGPTLSSLKEFCRDIDPEMRGYAIGNLPDLAAAHNRYAKPDLTMPTPPPSKRGTLTSSLVAYQPETYHFVSYIPFGDRLFELDGLKEWPIDHGPWAESEDWTDLFQRVIKRRLNEGDGIQYNLMALIPDPLPKLSQELKLLQMREKDLLDLIYDLAKEKAHTSLDGRCNKSDTELEDDIKVVLRSLSTVTIDDDNDGENHKNEEARCNLELRLKMAVRDVQINKRSLNDAKKKFHDELETRKRYQVDAERRTHNYDDFFKEYFKALATYHLLPSKMMETKKTTSKRGRKPSGKKRRPNGSH